MNDSSEMILQKEPPLTGRSLMYGAFLKMVEERLPEFCSRQQAEQAMDGLLRARTMANLFSRGRGPHGILFGKRMVYQKQELIAWLEKYFTERSRPINVKGLKK